MRTDSRAVLEKALDDNPEEYAAIKGDAKEGSLLEWVDRRAPDLHEFVALARVLPKLINDDAPGNVIINMRWEVLHLEGGVDLLISDRPALRLGRFDSREGLIVLPIGPHKLFVASHYDRGFGRRTSKAIAQGANRDAVLYATERVYGTGSQHLPLVRKLMLQKDIGDGSSARDKGTGVC